MSTNLYLVRHAHSAYTPDELSRPLSERGLVDARRVSHLLEKENIDLVISSPYKRAFQSVERVAQHIGKEVIIEDGFKERKLSEKPFENFNFAIKKVWDHPTFSWEGGESNAAAQKRGVNATLKVLKRFEGRNIVVGTHGNIMVLIMNKFDKKYGFHFWEGLNMPDIYKLTFDKQNLEEVKRIWEKC